MERYFYTAKYTVPAEAVNKTFTTNFKPQWVKVFNMSGKCTLEWTDTMDAAAGYKVKTGIDATADTVSLHGPITEKGITVLENGFTLGLDTDINVATHVLHVVAGRNS